MMTSTAPAPEQSAMARAAALRALLATARARRKGLPLVVDGWTGASIRALREACRMSLRTFAAAIGVSGRIVSKWEAGAGTVRPRPGNQARLDLALARLNAEQLARFAQALHAAACDGAGPVERDWQRSGGGGAPFELHLTLTCTTREAAEEVAAELVHALHGHPDFDAARTTLSGGPGRRERDAVPVLVSARRPSAGARAASRG